MIRKATKEDFDFIYQLYMHPQVNLSSSKHMNALRNFQFRSSIVSPAAMYLLPKAT